MEWRSPSELRDAQPWVQIIYCCYSPFLHDVYVDTGYLNEKGRPFLHDVYVDTGYLNEKGRIVNGYGDDFTLDDERFYGWIPVPEPLTERMEFYAGR